MRNEGWFDPWLLLSAFKKKVLSMGVHYVTGELSAVAVEDKRVSSVEVCRCLKYGYTLSDSGNCFYYRRPKLRFLTYCRGWGYLYSLLASMNCFWLMKAPRMLMPQWRRQSL